MTVDPRGLAAFMAILQLKSFEKAAAQLFVTQSAVSQRLKQLEQKLGASLIIRSPEIAPTPAGQALLKYAQNLQQLERSLQASLEPSQQLGWIKIAIGVNADTLATWLLTALAPWCQHERVLLDLRVDDQEETHHLLNQGEVVGCISAREKVAQGSYCTALGSITYHCVASPAFFKTYFADGVDATGLAAAPMVRFSDKDLLQHQYLDSFFGLDGDRQLQHMLPSSEGYVEWIRLGMGFGMLPTAQMQSLVDAGELRELTPQHTINVPLYWHQRGARNALGESLARQILQAAQDD